MRTAGQQQRRRGLGLLGVILGGLIPAVAMVATPKHVGATDPYSTAILADSPVLYYRLDESSGTAATDSSGNGYTGTYNSSGVTLGASGALIGNSDTAATNSGPDALVSGSGGSLPTGTSDRTVEVWLKVSGGWNGQIIDYGGAAESIEVDYHGGATNSAAVGLNNVDYVQVDVGLGDGAWHLFDLVSDSSATTVYIDGQRRGLLPAPGSVSSGTIDVGGDGTDGGAGTFDEAAVYSALLTPEQISAHWTAGSSTASACASAPTSNYATAVLADSPDLFFRLNDLAASSTARVAFDSAHTSNCHNGAYHPGTTSRSPGAMYGESMSGVTTASSDGVAMTATDDGLVTGTSARTVEVWTQITGANGTFFTWDGQELEIDFIGGAPNEHLCVNWAYCAVSPKPLNDSPWHLIDVTYDGTTSVFYVDGQNVGEYTASLSLGSGSGITLGSMGTYGSSAGGYEDLAIYPSALSASRVNAHWTLGASQLSSACAGSGAGPVESAVIASAPVEYFPMAEASSGPTGDVAMDVSGNCLNGAYTAGVTRSTPGPSAADISSGTRTDSTNYMALTADDLNFPTGGAARSIEFWIKTPVPAANSYVLTVGDGADTLSFDWLGGGGPVNFIVNNTTVLAIGAAIDDGHWHLIDLVHDGSGNVLAYADGNYEDTQAISASGSPGGGLSVAGLPGGSFAGVSLYDYALSGVQIGAHKTAADLVGGPFSGRQTEGGGNNVCIPCLHHALQNSVRHPVNTATGAMWDTTSDISIDGRGTPLGITRTYNSDMAAVDGPFGYGWSTNYGSVSLGLSGTTPHKVATITQENGSQATFDEPPSGTSWSATAPRFTATLTHNLSGTWTLVRHAQDTLTFDSSGNLIAEADANGYTTTFTYSTGQLVTVTDNAGRSLTINWTSTHITSVVDANVSPSRTVSYSYNGSGELTDVTDVNGGTTEYAYDGGGGHLLEDMLDPNCYIAGSGCNGGHGVQTDYNLDGTVAWQKDQLGRQTSFDYSSIPGATIITDPVGNEEVDYYESGLLIARTLGYGTADEATWQYAYDPETLIRTDTIDPMGGETTETDDASGNVLTVTDPLGRVTTRTYNGFNEVLTSEDPNGVTTTNTYDGNGNLTQTSSPLVGTANHQVTDFHHANMTYPGDVTSVDDPNGKTTYFHYDANGYQDQVKDPLGHVTGTVHNAIGWVTATYTPKAGCTWNSSPPTGCSGTYEIQYDYIIPGTSDTNEFGDVQTVTDQLSHTAVFGYDADRNRTSVQDGNGNTTTTTFDLANEPTTVTRPDSTTQVTDYHDDGTVLDQKDGAGHAIQTYGYDHLARVNRVTDALSNETDYTLDRNGNVLTKVDPSGSCSGSPTGCTTMTYDADNELKTVSYSDGVTPNVTNVAYDDDGQRTGMTDGTGTSSWAYDSLHRLTSYQNGNGKTVSYGYGSDLKNQVNTIAYPNSAGTVTQTWNDDGTMASVEDWNSKTTTFGYDANANLTGITVPSTLNVVDTFGFNAADQMTSVSDSNGATLFSASYGRDSNGQLSSDSSLSGSVGSFKYTSLNQLCYAGSSTTNACSSPPGSSQAYGFDAADNLTTNNGTAQQFNAADELCWTVSGTSANNCATAPTGATTYNYDTRGNRTSAVPSGGSATCDAYDQANRLASVKTGTGSSCTSPTTVGTYAYDGSGLRQSKTVSATTSQFVWNPRGGLPVLLQEKAGAGTAVNYIYGPGGLPVEQITGGTTQYLHHDQLGSTRLVTDAAGATGTATTTTYDPYGNQTASSGSLTTHLMFGGQYLDTESGMYYLRARYYDPVTAHFLTMDPAVAITKSPYGYVDSNPLNGLDVTGLDCSWSPLDWGACAGDAWNASGGRVVGAVQDFGNSHVFGLCVNASAGLIVGGTASGCFAFNLHSVGFTGTVGGGLDIPGAADISAGPMVTDAHDVSDLQGGFQYTEASAGDGLAATAQVSGGKDPHGRDVHCIYIGIGGGYQVPIPVAGGVGYTNTWTWSTS
jgi:RHS repeat-associated protein